MFDSLQYPPHNDYQFSVTPRCDLEGCLSFARTHCVEPLCKLYGDNTQYNPQYLAATSHTTAQGNTAFNVDLAYYQNGMVSTDVLPELTNFTWDDVYGRDLTNIIPIGQRFWDKYDPKESAITPIDASQALQIAEQATFDNPYTVQIIVDLNKGMDGLHDYHSQALLGSKIWDSYPTNPKNIDPTIPIIWAYKVTLKPKTMSNVLLVKKGSEYGFYLPATNEQSMIDKANNFGYPLPIVNNGTAVDWPNVKPDVTI